MPQARDLEALNRQARSESDSEANRARSGGDADVWARAVERDAKRREEARKAERASQATSSTATEDGIAAARRESGLDTIAALRSLGFTVERARLAAERTESLADGPL